MLAEIGPDVSDVTETLRSVAVAYAPESREYRTLVYAASALLFLNDTQQLSAFDSYVVRADRPLSETQRASLREIGLTDDSL